MQNIMMILAGILLVAGCGPHQVDIAPVQVEPIQLTLDINVKVQQEQIEEAAAELSPVIGKTAPDFTLPDQNKIPFTLSDMKGKWVVIYFYPKNGTPGCTLEAKHFSSLAEQFKGLNTMVVGISDDSSENLMGESKKDALRVNLIKN